MKQFIFIFSFLVFHFQLNAQAPEIQWIRTFGDSGLADIGHSVQQTTDEGYIITGSTNSYGAGSADVWLIKTDANGDTLWTRTFGGNEVDIGKSVQQTSDGGYVIVGGTGSFGAGGEDVWLIKTDANGDTMWTKTFGGSNNDEGNSIDITSDGGYIITGVNSGDVLLIKTDANGDILWTKTFGDSLGDVGNSVQQTTDGGYIITGVTNRITANPGWIYQDIWLIKTDANGDTLWTKIYRDSSDLLRGGNSVQQVSDGGYILTGVTNKSRTKPPEWWSKGDLWLVRTDANGDTIWTRTYGKSDDYNAGSSVQQTVDGGYIICGYTDGFTSGVYQSDLLLIKMDANGDTLWSKIFEGYGWQYGFCVQQTTDGGYIVTGIDDGNVLLIKIAPDVTSIVENPHISVKDYQLYQNFPNPFNPITIINYQLPVNSEVELSVYNLLGQKVTTLVNQIQSAGRYTVQWDASGFASGVYFYTLETERGFKQSKKLLFIK